MVIVYPPDQKLPLGSVLKNCRIYSQAADAHCKQAEDESSTGMKKYAIENAKSCLKRALILLTEDVDL